MTPPKNLPGVETQMSDMAGMPVSPGSKAVPRGYTRRSLAMAEASMEAKALADEFAAITSQPESFASSAINENATFLKMHDEAHETEERYGKHSWQARTVHFLHSRQMQLIFSVLLMIDVSAVVVELFLEAHFPSCHFVTRDAVSCCPKAATGFETAMMRRLGGGHGHHDLCAAGFEPFEGTPAGCDEHKWETVHILHEVCFGITVGVLSTFFIELIMLMYIQRAGFFKNFLYVLDFVIVTGTLSLEFFHRSELAHNFDPVKILILARCWRFVRIGHGLVVETHEHGEKEAHHLKHHCQELVGKLQRLHAKLEHARSIAQTPTTPSGTPMMSGADSDATPVGSPTAGAASSAAKATTE